MRERTRELEEAYREVRDTQLEILDRLALAAEYRDDDTGRHAHRVAALAAQMAEVLGLPAAEVELIGRAALLHDLGKIAIADQLLRKPARFTPEEREAMRAHPTTGARIVAGSHSRLLQCAEQIARTHHERWDGTGHPDGLQRDAIPLAGRIVAVADVFDALTHARPYKPAWPVAEALAEIGRQRDRQFDPQVVDAFLQLVQGIALDGERGADRVAVVS